MEFGCGQCAPCRVNRRRVWTARLLAELTAHKFAWFVTGTYREDAVPSGGTLRKRDHQLFLKLLRKRSGEALRYFAVGEYGDSFGRPHYHWIIFGLSRPELIAGCWPHGFVHVAPVNRERCAYVVGYTMRKLTKDSAQLESEFATMSRRPGIGADFSDRMGKNLERFLQPDEDVPRTLRMDSELWPLGRYLRRRMRTACGLGASLPPSAALAASEQREAEALRLGDGVRAAQRAHSALKARHMAEIERTRRRKR
jgi:hypothetical protein